MIFTQQVVCFLFPSFGEGIENTLRVGYQNKNVTSHFSIKRFSFYVNHPPKAMSCLTIMSRDKEQLNIKDLSHA